MRSHLSIAAMITGLLLTGCGAGGSVDDQEVPTLTAPPTAQEVPEGAAATYFSVACLSGDSIEAFDGAVADDMSSRDELVAAATMHEREMTVASGMLAAQEWPDALHPAVAELSGYFQDRIALAREVLADPSSASTADAGTAPVVIDGARQSFSDALGVPLDPPCH